MDGTALWDVTDLSSISARGSKDDVVLVVEVPRRDGDCLVIHARGLFLVPQFSFEDRRVMMEVNR